MANEDKIHTVTIDLPEAILERIPDVPQELLRTMPYVVGGEDSKELEAILKGKCLVCTSDLAEDTAVLCDGTGILYVVCNPMCLDDMIIFGWLSEKAKDLMDTVQFRGEANAVNQSGEES